MLAIWLLCGCYVADMWLLYSFYGVDMWLLFGCYVVSIWLLCGCYIVVIWLQLVVLSYIWLHLIALVCTGFTLNLIALNMLSKYQVSISTVLEFKKGVTG